MAAFVLYEKPSASGTFFDNHYIFKSLHGNDVGKIGNAVDNRIRRFFI
jgi:hypothetical protein